MKRLKSELMIVTTAALMCVSAAAQNATAKPSPYSGVSQPPGDDTIVTDTAPSEPSPATAAAPAQPAPAAAAPSSVPAPRATTPAIANPANDLDADIVTSVPTKPGELPEGTTISLLLDQELSTENTRAGDDFSGRISKDVMSGEKVVIPQGSQIVGKVIRVTEGKRFGNSASIRLRPDMVILPDGSRCVLHATVIDTRGKSRVDDEGALKPNSQVKKDAILEGAGVGGGAAVGAALGGPVGAVVGTFVGAGVMTTHILVQPPGTIDVPKNTEIVLSLTEPMSINPAQTN